ncbi:MAG: MBL fold metallo-hydrolase [Acidimicrobiia bacterium]
MSGGVQIGRGVHFIRLPLPFAPRLPSVNAYVFSGNEGLTVLDVGVGSEEGYRILVEGLEELGPGLAGLRRVIGSHLHVDHMGLASRLVAETGCKFLMHTNAIDDVPAYNDWSIIRSWVSKLALLHGAPPDHVETTSIFDFRPDWAPETVPPTPTVSDGDRIPLEPGRWLEVVHTPGHEQAHICLLDSATGILYSGDHVLPRITPFIPYLDDLDTLGSYLSSLDRVVQIDPTLTYPAHGGLIERGAARARQIALHHERRLGAMLEVVRKRPATAWEVMSAVFRPNLGPVDSRLAFQETMAHLEYLRLRGRLEQVEQDGVLAYRQPPWRHSSPPPRGQAGRAEND